jgi:hypothetical protein
MCECSSVLLPEGRRLGHHRVATWLRWCEAIALPAITQSAFAGAKSKGYGVNALQRMHCTIVINNAA